MKEKKQRQQSSDRKKMILTLGIVVVSYFLIDYFNLPSLLGLDVSNINTDFLGIFSNALVAAVIFALTYLYVEKRSVQQAKSQRTVLLSFLKQAYEECEKQLAILSLYSQRGDPIPMSLNRNGRADPQNVADDYLGIVFNQEPFYLQFLLSGIVPSEVITTYFSIKEGFRFSVVVATYAGLAEDFRPDFTSLQDEVKAAKQVIEEELEKQ